MESDSGSLNAYDDAYDEVEPRSSTSFDASLGLFLTAQGLPVLWSCPRALLEQTVPYDLPALHDAPPWSLAQLSRNTDQDVQYYSFLLRAWPLSAGAAELTFHPHESLAFLLAQVVRRLVADHPGFLFVQYGSGVDRMCRIGVVPARHSRTKWLLAFGAAIASTPAFRLDDSVRLLSFACRFLTVPQNPCGV
jgi:hypothetical protein